MSETLREPISTAQGPQQRINAYWSKRARQYDAGQVTRQERPGAREVWQEVWTASLPPPPADVLDLGTGTGNTALLLADLGYRVTGADLAEGMLQEARRKRGANGPRFVMADVVHPTQITGPFDALTARYVLWTLREPATALRNWYQLLRPGGWLVAVDSPWYPTGVRAVHDQPGATGPDQEFLTAYDEDALQLMPLVEAADISDTAEMVARAGFTHVRTEELPQVMDLDERYGVAPGHRVQMQYRITARRT